MSNQAIIVMAVVVMRSCSASTSVHTQATTSYVTAPVGSTPWTALPTSTTFTVTSTSVHAQTTTRYVTAPVGSTPWTAWPTSTTFTVASTSVHTHATTSYVGAPVGSTPWTAWPTSTTVTVPSTSVHTQATTSYVTAPVGSTPSTALPRRWSASQLPITIETQLDTSAVVSSVTIFSDWWMKRPKDIEITLFSTRNALVPQAKLQIEYPSSRNICGPGGDEDCTYPQTPTSSHTVQVCDGSPLLCQPASVVRVAVRTPQNANGEVIIQEVSVAYEGQTTTPPTSGNVLLEMTDAGVDCGQLPDLQGLTMVHSVNLSNIDIPRSSNDNPKLFGYQTGNNWVARFTATLSVCKGGQYDFSLSLGTADTAALIIDGFELARSACLHWGGSLTATVNLDSGFHDLQIIYGDDGWSDEVALSYKGADSCMSWVVVPSSAFLQSGETDVRCSFASECPSSTSRPAWQTSPRATSTTTSIQWPTTAVTASQTTSMLAGLITTGQYERTLRATTTTTTVQVRTAITTMGSGHTTEGHIQHSTTRMFQHSFTTVAYDQTSTSKTSPSTTNTYNHASTTLSILRADTTTTTTASLPPQTTSLKPASQTSMTTSSGDFLRKAPQTGVMASNSELVEAEYVEMSLVVKSVDYAKLVANQAVREEFELQVKHAIADESGPAVTSDDIALKLSPGSVVVSASISLPESLGTASVLHEVRNGLSSSAVLPQMVAEHIRGMEKVDTIATGKIVVNRGAVSIKSKLVAAVSKEPSIMIRNASTTISPSARDVYENISGARERTGKSFVFGRLLIWLLALSASVQG